jgi:type 2 lantibiotic biosynthesis protein LanM
MDNFYEHLIVRCATIDELLSDSFERLPGQKADTDLAARRLAAWCRSSASGDWSLFSRRLERDGHTMASVLEGFATVRRKPSASTPAWIDDAIWIEAALQDAGESPEGASVFEPVAFEHLLAPLADQAGAKLWAGIDARARGNLTESARGGLRHSFLKELADFCAAALYEQFGILRSANAKPADAVAVPPNGARFQYDRFVAEMKSGHFRRLFEEKPVLLRLIATVTRQWIDTTHEFVMRLDADLADLRRDILHCDGGNRVVSIQGDLSDPHNGGRSVLIVGFEGGSRVVYKPKDLRLDVAWHALVERLNLSGAPVALKAVRAIARNGYGWTEFIDHTGCADEQGYKRFFRRAGAWLALFYCFAASDMHHQNIIATGDHPVPIDLETLLQAAAEKNKNGDAEAEAYEVARQTVENSVMMVGLLPAYGRSPEFKVFAIGGLASGRNSRPKREWSNINTDTMRPAKSVQAGMATPNLPHVNCHYAKFGDHISDFISGFEDYAGFLLSQSRDAEQGGLFDGFTGLPVRKILRPTRFYYMLLHRLRDHRTMGDGAIWSAQADFPARMADWENDSDPFWPFQRAERLAVLSLNVPHFVSPSDGSVIRDATGISVRKEAMPGIYRARARVQGWDVGDIALQIEVIRQNTAVISRSAGPELANLAPRRLLRPDAAFVPNKESFLVEAERIAAEISNLAIRKGPSAAWIGVAWLGDSEVFHLIPLGASLYDGVCGIAVFLAAHASVMGCKSSGELALAAVSHIRKSLRGGNAARIARALGTGGATGLGSIVYALAIMSKCLHDDDLLADAHRTAALFSEDLIASDTQLDIIGGSAGGILGLLRLYRDSQSEEVLARATKCGDHLLAQTRNGSIGRRTWIGQGAHKALNGMSHGAAGYAYALAGLGATTGREDFLEAASECIAFENSSYDETYHNWPDYRGDKGSLWPCQWCHGATGIGLARVAMMRRAGRGSTLLAADVFKALAGVERGWPGDVDTMCCGTFGSIEFLCEAGAALGRPDLGNLASRRMMAVIETALATGDYRWNAFSSRFNLGLFRGLAGAGYTILRRADDSLPNVLIWE